MSPDALAPEREWECRRPSGHGLFNTGLGANAVCTTGAVAGPDGRVEKSGGGCWSCVVKSRWPGNMEWCSCMSCIRFIECPDELGGLVPGNEGIDGSSVMGVMEGGIEAEENEKDEEAFMCGGGGSICSDTSS